MQSLFFILLLLAPALAAAQAPQAFIVTGQVNPHLNAPAKVYLYSLGTLVDSAVVKKGRFIIKGLVETPSRASMILSRQGKITEDFMRIDAKYGFYLEPGTTRFTSADSLKYASVIGGYLTTDWQQLVANRQPALELAKRLQTEYDKTSPEQRKNLAFRQARREGQAVIHREYNRLDSLFIVTHPTSKVSLDQLGLMSGTRGDSALVKKLFSIITPSLRATAEGQEIVKKLVSSHISAPLIGQLAHDFTLLTSTGQFTTLSSYRGKYVLIDFWASWCGPCRAENPNVVRAYKVYKNKNFEILSVSIDAPDARNKWLKAVEDDKLPWTQVIDNVGPNSAAIIYGVQAIPQNFLIDPTGNIIALNLRGEALQRTLARFIK